MEAQWQTKFGNAGYDIMPLSPEDITILSNLIKSSYLIKHG